jgi:hypothetical protein
MIKGCRSGTQPGEAACKAKYADKWKRKQVNWKVAARCSLVRTVGEERASEQRRAYIYNGIGGC